MPLTEGFDELFVEFAQELRLHGMLIGSDDVITFCNAVSVLDATDVMNVYWAGRTSLVRRKENIPVYNEIFQRFFFDNWEEEASEVKQKFRAQVSTTATIEIPENERTEQGDTNDDTKMGFMAASHEIFRSKAFNECTPQELAALRKMMSNIRLNPPIRRTRRLISTSKGKKLNMRKIVRENMRAMGENREIFYTKKKEKLRPIVFILDISGSMADYSRNLLQLAYSARSAHQKVEVFCFGTRLTRVTRSLSRRNPDQAMELAGTEAMDWEGGTRIGDAINTFLKKWGRGRVGRGSIVVICSDGLDRGNPETLAKSMEALSRIAHRIVWMNPHRGDADRYVPTSMGMIIAEPFIDEVVSGHNLKSLEEFSRKLVSIR
ncbi:MAG: vWA domain-containing protein [Candidatus Planktophila sp.]